MKENALQLTLGRLWRPNELFSALATAIVSVVSAVSLATLIFDGALSPHLAQGVNIALVSGLLVGLIVSLAGSCNVTIAIPQDRTAPILAAMASSIVATAPATATGDEIAANVSLAIAATTLITGFFLLGLGVARTGGLMRYIPYSVLGGFFAGTGWLLLVGGLRVMTGIEIDSLSDTPTLVDPALLARWLPGLLLAVAVFAVRRYSSSVLALPLMLLAGTGLFYLAMLTGGTSMESIAKLGWLVGPMQQATGGSFAPSLARLLESGSLFLVLDQWGSISAVALVGAVSILLTVSALELASGQDIDVNRELRVAGTANLVAGLAGGMVGFHSLSLSDLAIKLGASTHAPAVVAALACGAALFLGADLFGYLPRIVVGALLMYLGLSFLGEWLIGAYRRLPQGEYLVVPIILLTIAFAGIVPGVLAGLLAAVVLFVVNYSRTQVIRYALSGEQAKSTVERGIDDERLLLASGEQLYLLKLRGYLFFGTAAQLLDCLRKRSEYPGKVPLRFVVLDLEQVTGIDSSAAYVFHRMRRMAEQKEFSLIFCGLAPALQHRLVAERLVGGVSALSLFVDADHALEWYENQVLRCRGSGGARHTTTLVQRLSALIGNKGSAGDLLEYLVPVSFVKEQELIKQGDDSTELYFLEEGEVSVWLSTPDGRRSRIRRTGPGTVLGELGLYLGTPRTATVVADSPGSAFLLTAEAIERMETKRPDLASTVHRFMADLLAERLLRTTQTLEAVLD